MECWADTHKIPLSMDQFPTTFCNTLADKKMIAWSNMAKILAAKSIAKTYQNSKDVHIEKVTGKYAKLLEKWSSYQRIIADTVI